MLLGENFEVQLDNDIIPIEVKSGKSVFSPSIIEYKKMYGGEKTFIIRYSLKNLVLDADVLNIPLFMIDKTKKLIALAKQHLKQ